MSTTVPRGRKSSRKHLNLALHLPVAKQGLQSQIRVKNEMTRCHYGNAFFAETGSSCPFGHHRFLLKVYIGEYILKAGFIPFCYKLPDRKWRETKQQSIRSTSDHHLSCCLVFLNFLMGNQQLKRVASELKIGGKIYQA